MKKNILKTAMGVELRNGKKYLVLLDLKSHGDILLPLDSTDRNHGNIKYLKNYKENTLHCGNKDFDIMKIYSISGSWAGVGEKIGSLMEEREEKAKKVYMTIEDIEKELNIENLNIVKKKP